MELTDVIPIKIKQQNTNNISNDTKTVRVQYTPPIIYYNFKPTCDGLYILTTKNFKFNTLNSKQCEKIKYILDSYEDENKLLNYTTLQLIQIFGCKKSQLEIKFDIFK